MKKKILVVVAAHLLLLCSFARADVVIKLPPHVSCDDAAGKWTGTIDAHFIEGFNCSYTVVANITSGAIVSMGLTLSNRKGVICPQPDQLSVQLNGRCDNNALTFEPQDERYPDDRLYGNVYQDAQGLLINLNGYIFTKDKTKSGLIDKMELRKQP